MRSLIPAHQAIQDFFSPKALASIDIAIAILSILGAAYLANLITKCLILRVVEAITRRTPFDWDRVFVRNGVFTRLSHLVPAIVLQLLTRWFFQDHPAVIGAVDSLVSLYLVFIAIMVFDGMVNAVIELLGRTNAVGLPLRGFGQALKLVAFLVGLIFCVSILFDKTPLYILSGLGALTAVLMLIFRDPILGFVAGIQLSANRMVRVGDWIEMPSHGADGDVLEVSLTTVKVRNWDNTFTAVPAYDLITRSFKNWRGMQDSGGRRIKRSILLDVHSIRFVDDEMCGRFSRFQMLRPHLEMRLKEIEDWNHQHNADLTEMVNGRRLTNIGCFRAYCIAYLRNHPKIHQSMMLLVRQLDPSPQGLPMEIYVFTNTIAWVEYESIQADIFDHLYAVLPLFDLRAYQFPTDGMAYPTER
jgi:miniconductance mechanosensitive channel